MHIILNNTSAAITLVPYIVAEGLEERGPLVPIRVSHFAQNLTNLIGGEISLVYFDRFICK